MKKKLSTEIHAFVNIFLMINKRNLKLPYVGLRHPEEAAGLGCGWILARVIFSLGYWTGKPIYRMPGVFLTTLVQAVLVGFMVSTAAGYLDWW